MRLAAYHRGRGDNVLLNPTPLDSVDLLYVSSLFTRRRRDVDGLVAHFRPHADVVVGGPGWDLTTRLPSDVDLEQNDYTLYHNLDYGIGYSTRGCIRQCAFCQKAH
jgi:hypothetical protein